MVSTEDRTLAFFENILSKPTWIVDTRQNFYQNIESTFLNTNIDVSKELITIVDYDENNESIFVKNYFLDKLTQLLNNERKISEELIKNKAAKNLSNSNPTDSFFKFTENTLIDLNKKSRKFIYPVLNETIVSIMLFFHNSYNKYYSFSGEYLDTLSIYNKIEKKRKLILSFNWKEENKLKELNFLYEKLSNSNPPLISASKETFIRAFSNQQLEKGECIKWLCKNVKNKTISKASLVRFIDILFEKGFIVSDKNDFNKITQNIFCYSNGKNLKDIKGSKLIKSKNPSCMVELSVIIDNLAKID